jgi:hypothetical protein
LIHFRQTRGKENWRETSLLPPDRRIRTDGFTTLLFVLSPHRVACEPALPHCRSVFWVEFQQELVLSHPPAIVSYVGIELDDHAAQSL